MAIVISGRVARWCGKICPVPGGVARHLEEAGRAFLCRESWVTISLLHNTLTIGVCKASIDNIFQRVARAVIVDIGVARDHAERASLFSRKALDASHRWDRGRRRRRR